MRSIFAQISAAALRRFGAATLAGAAAMTCAAAQDPATTKSPPDHSAESEIARYCGALAPTAGEARVAYQMRRLADLEREARDEVEKLEKKEAEAREWVTKRDEMMKAATDDVVAIYGKMASDAAAAQLETMDEPVAAAVLAKLNPRAAGDILGEMTPEKAAKLSTLLAGASAADKS